MFVVLLISIATIIYVIEGDENGFTSIPISCYWAVVTLTTVGSFLRYRIIYIIHHSTCVEYISLFYIMLCYVFCSFMLKNKSLFIYDVYDT